LCKALGREDLAGLQWDEEKREEVMKQLQEIFKTKTRDEWFKLLRDADVPIAPVYSLDEVFNDPQIQYRKVIEEVEHPEIGKVRVLRIPVEFSETPSRIRGPAPMLGQHTKEILKELGYSDREIEEFEKEGIV
jgi:crotonobetainyl-CoA:carnitine CoA-transferase CaiB-like acyl-CoA transferase